MQNYKFAMLFFLQPPGQPMMPNSMDPTRQGKRSFICQSVTLLFSGIDESCERRMA